MTKKSLVIGNMVGVGLVLVGVVAYLNLRRTPVGDMETPIADLRGLAAAALTYYQKYDAFPPNLAALGPPPNGVAPSASAAGFIDNKLASGSKLGYRYNYRAYRSRANGPLDKFTINADPGDGCSKDCPHYFMDEDCKIHREVDSSATAKSPLVNY